MVCMVCRIEFFTKLVIKRRSGNFDGFVTNLVTTKYDTVTQTLVAYLYRAA